MIWNPQRRAQYSARGRKEAVQHLSCWRNVEQPLWIGSPASSSHRNCPKDLPRQNPCTLPVNVGSLKKQQYIYKRKVLYSMVGEQEEKFQSIKTYRLTPVSWNISGTFPVTKQFTCQPAHSCLAHCSLIHPRINDRGWSTPPLCFSLLNACK